MICLALMDTASAHTHKAAVEGNSFWFLFEKIQNKTKGC